MYYDFYFLNCFGSSQPNGNSMWDSHLLVSFMLLYLCVHILVCMLLCTCTCVCISTIYIYLENER